MILAIMKITRQKAIVIMHTEFCHKGREINDRRQNQEYGKKQAIDFLIHTLTRICARHYDWLLERLSEKPNVKLLKNDIRKEDRMTEDDEESEEENEEEEIENEDGDDDKEEGDDDIVYKKPFPTTTL